MVSRREYPPRPHPGVDLPIAEYWMACANKIRDRSAKVVEVEPENEEPRWKIVLSGWMPEDIAAWSRLVERNIPSEGFSVDKIDEEVRQMLRSRVDIKDRMGTDLGPEPVAFTGEEAKEEVRQEKGERG